MGVMLGVMMRFGLPVMLAIALCEACGGDLATSPVHRHGSGTDIDDVYQGT
jgi:hypothetical protein